MSSGRTTARRLLQSILASEWAIRPEWLNQFASIAQRLGDGGSAELDAEGIRAEIRRALATLNEGRDTPDAEAYDFGEGLSERSRASVRDGVAIIPVTGPLYHYAEEFHDVCGCSSYTQIARDIATVRAAREDGAVHSALFYLDTPGGEVGGCAEAADLIRELASEMPTAGYVADLCCSAGFWLASAMSEIHVARAALLGSIGVVAAYRPRSKEREAVIEIVSSQSPRKRPDVETEEGRAQVQKTVDALADVFVGDVARNRGVSVQKVLADFGQGDVLVGARAIAAGLADHLGSFDSVAAMMAAPTKGVRPGRSFHASDQEEDVNPSQITIEYLEQNHASLLTSIRTAAATAERERILAIEGYALKGHEKLLAAAKTDPACTAEVFATRVLRAEQGAGAEALKQLQADETSIDVKPVSLASDEVESAPTSTAKGPLARDPKKVSQIVNAGRS